MPHKKAKPKPVTPLSVSAFEQAWSSTRAPQMQRPAPPTVSGRWLLKAGGITLVAAAACVWAALCLLFWQGGWQLLYHPTAAVTRTPASLGLAFDPVGFATTEAGEPRLRGWWIPAEPDARYSRYTVLYLHGQDGNLSDAVDALAALHAVGVNVLAFDYRGYGQSQFTHPSEALWREDAESALQYLTATRHIASGTIILDGRDLGANLALEVGAQHAELAGIVLREPLEAPMDAIFNDPRAKLVPARLMVHDRFDANSAAAALLIPSLWLIEPVASNKIAGQTQYPAVYNGVTARKMFVRLKPMQTPDPHLADAYSRWLDDLPVKNGTP
jgi:pimeloyl-ACP methyl ester carboxylesterase